MTRLSTFLMLALLFSPFTGSAWLAALFAGAIVISEPYLTKLTRRINNGR